ncbi:NAD(P)-dependent oxidoreductase [Streptomyces mesophilus]|uniref:NAD(P)-dependent oxidoreductase n=1 Tax=Streptomyces mesophilus TaxID=1775132 RepID=UPI0033319FE2
MKLVVFGANGPTGRRTTAQALADGHEVTAVTRRPDDFPLDDPRLRIVGADVRDPLAVEAVVAGQHAVISSLGVPYGRSRVSLYSEGSTHITQAMAKHGVRRLVCVTSTVLFDTEAPGEGFLFRKVVEPLIARTMGRTVYDDMRRMEAVIRDSGLDWTVVRPGGLFDADAVTDYQVAATRLPGRFTSRSDLAHSLVRRAVDGLDVHTFIDVRTTDGAPTFLELLRKEAFGGKKAS